MTQSSKEYAMALFSLACESGEEEVFLENMELVESLLKACPQYLDLLETPTIQKSERISLISEAFGDNLHQYLLSFLMILTEKNEIHMLFDCIADYRTLYYKKKGILTAVVMSARPLNHTEQKQLIEAMQRRTGKTVELICRHDPSLLGGMVVEADGIRYDGSLRGRLNEVKEVMQK